MNRWYRLPETTGPLNDAQPDLKGYNVDGWSGNAAHPDGAPTWIVRVYADQTTLDNLASESGVVELSNVPVDTLNQIFNQNRDEAGWERGFKVGD